MTLIEDMQERIKKCADEIKTLEDSISVHEVDLMIERGKLKQLNHSMTLCKNRLKKAESGG